MDRRGFARRAGWGFLAGVAVTLSPGCGSLPTEAESEGSATGTISLNHGHEAVITAARLAAGGDLQLDITGRSTHGHVVVLTPQDLARIGAGERVSRNSSDGFDDKHDHVVTFN